MIKDLLKKKLLQLVAYDEIHLFNEFGRVFRKEFSSIPNVIDTPVHQLLMTATCNKEIQGSIENLLSLSVNTAVWGNNKEQEMRKVDIRVMCNIRPGKMVFKALKEMLEDNVHKKALVYASSQAKIDCFQ